MSEFQIGRRARGGGGGSPVSRPQGSGRSANTPASTGGRGRGPDISGPSGLGIIGRLTLSEGVSARNGPYTLDTAVEDLERKVFEILDEKDPTPNPNLQSQIAAGPTMEIGSDEHIDAARAGDAAWLPLPLSLSRMLNWESKEYDKGLHELNRYFMDINTEIDAYVRENDLTDAQIKSLLRKIMAPKDNSLFGDGDDFEEDVIRNKPGKDTFGAFYTLLLNFPKNERGGYPREVRQSMRSLFDQWGSGNIARTLVDGALDVLSEEADRMGIDRHTDPDDRNQEISLAILNLVSDVGKDSIHWTSAEHRRWSQFVEEVRQGALNHGPEVLAALREKYANAEEGAAA